MKIENCVCDICNNEGWVETSVYGSVNITDGTLVIQRCDDCNIFTDDFSAAKFAFENHNIYSLENDKGFNVIGVC